MTFYRIRAIFDGCETIGFDVAKAEVETFSILRETRCGYWIVPSWADTYGLNREKHKRWISKDSRKRHAYPTMEEAVDSFRHRCHHRLGHARRGYENAMAVYALSKEHDPVSHAGKVVVRGNV